ncbi:MULTISPECIES: c-type cytochrome [Bacteria]|nr:MULTISPECIES: cytochrome c [Bacteria]MCB2426203.1 cytochrome c [Methylophaga pinxianii]MDO8886793.1 cytochrome c [Candidatus Oleimmundimicrobium sp.]UPH47294.1 cytochrome c [Methylophaga pinxianii]
MASGKLLSCVKCLLAIAVIVIAGGAVFLYSGWYPMGADVPHNRFTYWILETLRERSIARAAGDVEIPMNLDSSDRLLSGGADYNDMCAGCHLKPGKTQSDFTLGLYPAPPNLTRDEHRGGINNALDQRRFWIIKHGIKASGMPAWGPGHDDERIWNMVAFLKRLPELTPEQYQILTARGDDQAEHH